MLQHFCAGNWIVVKLVSAWGVVAALQNGVSQWSASAPAGRFPQVGYTNGAVTPVGGSNKMNGWSLGWATLVGESRE